MANTWINWLNQRDPQQHFSLVPLQLDDLSQDKANNIDFILTNQSQFFISMISLSVGWATLQSPSSATHNVGKVGSAILVITESDFHQITDF
ncbi:hypothetical protein INT80_02775 [Gallibacterium anatis]|uniref:Uncharacterized protein n=1 Tax=Gallibacterium anatis TaxID=750 RepID=A0A930UU76_9PAST|nr:hypothetical protein [Gallibacterium anatis]